MTRLLSSNSLICCEVNYRAVTTIVQWSPLDSDYNLVRSVKTEKEEPVVQIGQDRKHGQTKLRTLMPLINKDMGWRSQ